ncbi:MAG: sigma-70 family RNA polymerase sigma factor [Planctomycetota bacterium]|jgi:RNA polymerase sigma-70 factor (ECF subfamily)|nr:sigma-70 family RNA polymerase sigma factor [Planctomycetota bacterium]MDP6762728.1 sigma-70 family RNA polymerase sigma factor [Planctomycetota bacterium]MDP6988546.1 sigma-70 family RNA polymerase sigma factor [Planctomycetota bacterium]
MTTDQRPDHPQGSGSAYASDPGVQLMLAWQGGDEEAFERLVEEYSPRVYALLTRFVGRRSVREDMVQEVFLRVVRSRDRYQPTARFSTWLYRIAFNLSVNETQRGAGNKTLSLDVPFAADEGEHGSLGDLQESEVEDPSAALERDDVVLAVRAAIAALPEKQRMALILAKYHDYPYVEIADVLGSSEKAIKSLIHRARESLRETLSPFLQRGEVA